ncbi:ATP-binding protein [Saccharothrix stipae]
MVLVDVESFSSPTRTLHHQPGPRTALYEVVGEALAAAGVPWDICHDEAHGDGLFLLIPPDYPKAPLVEVLPEALARAVRGHNATSPDAARTRLRLAVHAGEVALDQQGATSASLTTAFRLLDSPPLKNALADSPGVVAMIVSQVVFDEVVRHCATLDPATFRPVEAAVEGLRGLAWIALPDHPHPPDLAVLNQRRTDSTSFTLAPDGRNSTVPGTGASTDTPGPRNVTIAGGVHGVGSGITIGAATGDRSTIGTPPIGGPDNPPAVDTDSRRTVSAHDLAHPESSPARVVARVGGDVNANGGAAVGTLTGDLHLHQAVAPPPVPIPRQLLPPPADFIGRDDALATLDHALTVDPNNVLTDLRDQGRKARQAVITAVGGTGGIGKTWLALTWAHRNLSRFPDGQLFADLHGFGPGAPRHAGDVLADFLAALGVDRDLQPQQLDARAALYRTHTTGKRLLVLLDNAATAEQVVPLLPGGTTCTVLITSRHRLPSLITRHGACPVTVDVLTETEARTLLSAALGSAYATASAQRAVAELIKLCSGLPLALGLVAARVRPHPELLEDIVAELRDLGVDALDSDDPEASLRAVLSWSLRQLTSQQHAAFALLGIAPGPDIDLPAAASLTGLPQRQAYAVLRGLVDTSLLGRTPGGRYVMHDLVRHYAADTAQSDLSDLERTTALERVVDFYLHTAHSAACLLNPRGIPIQLDPPSTGTQPPRPLRDMPAAMAWLDAHHAHLLIAQRLAAAHHDHQTVWRMAWALANFHPRRGHSHDALTVWTAAIAAAEHLADPSIHATTYRFLGHAHAMSGQHEQAITHLHHALSLAERHHDLAQQAPTHSVLMRTWELHGDHRHALEHARRALDLYRALDRPAQIAEALNTVGWHAANVGDYDTAREHCQAALVLHRKHGDFHTEAATLDSLGFIDHHTGHHLRAVRHYRQALRLYRNSDSSMYTADTLDHLGHSYTALGRHEQARAAWTEALELYRQQGRITDVQRVHHQLDNPTGREDEP